MMLQELVACHSACSENLKITRLPQRDISGACICIFAKVY